MSPFFPCETKEKFIAMMNKTLDSSEKWPTNYSGKSQIAMLEKYKYLTHKSDSLTFGSESQIRYIKSHRTTLDNL